jgi:hypothetical protein
VSELAGTGIPWLDAILAILGAGGVTAALTAFFDYRKKRRDETFEMAKEKLDVIGKSLPIYIQLLSLYTKLGDYLKSSSPDGKQCLYFLCRILYHQNSIFKTYGSLQLDDLDAETLVASLGNEILGVVMKKFGRQKIATMTKLVGDKDYDTFLTDLPSHDKLYCEFETWLFEYNSTLPPGSTRTLKNLGNKCKWYSELILFELNYIYRYWYGENPRFYSLTPELVNYLESDYKLDDQYRFLDRSKPDDKRSLDELDLRFTNYYNRIAWFESYTPHRGKKRRM